ncbi:hypothetical protein TNCV_4473871 [Trichonephila clavipes]|nr:hypothetical protein TNCV_4473871 [Trichonephila clavipes]
MPAMIRYLDHWATAALEIVHELSSYFSSESKVGGSLRNSSRIDLKYQFKQVRLSPSGSNDSSGIVNHNLHDSAESDLRVSLVDNGLVGPYSATVFVTLSSAPDHRPPRLESAR